nr:MAG TPA: hypothetical protein [Caudoviricetes sp.]
MSFTFCSNGRFRIGSFRCCCNLYRFWSYFFTIYYFILLLLSRV